MEAPQGPPLNDAEQALTDAIGALVGHINTVREAALAVNASGGSARAAFLASVDEEMRPQLALQWPMFAMMLGLPPT